MALNAWGQDEKTAKEVRKRLREQKKQDKYIKAMRSEKPRKLG